MSTETNKPEKIYQGIPASPGLAHGLAFVFLQKELEVPTYGVDSSRFDEEIARYQDAIGRTREQIVKIREAVKERLGEQEAQIFDAHLLVLDDKALIDETIQLMKENACNIEYCFHKVSKKYIEAFEQIDDEYIKERATDIRDVSKRVLRNLLGEKHSAWMRFDGKRIVLAENLAPSDTSELNKDSIIAFATNKGSRTSHSVIMARSLQVPAVVGLNNITDQVENDDYVVVDGYDGVVIVNPSESTMARYGQIKREKRSVQKVFESVNPLPAKTRDGVRIRLMVNVDGEQDVRNLYAVGSDGVGLFRTEALFLRKETAPTEDEQFEIYKNVAESMAPEVVTIRTLDLGGDKKAHNFFVHEKEENPFMGFRAIRFCLEHKDVFREQLRAILRASHYGSVRIMYPMIISPVEIAKANELLEECKQQLEAQSIPFNKNIAVGSMIETPGAALIVDLLAEYCSFFSIGTNDLIQYTLAVDRVNDRIAHLYQPNHPAVIRMLHSIVDGAKKHNIPVSVCGEIAGDPIYSSLLIGMGVESLSVTPACLPEVKYLVRSMKYSEAQELACSVFKENEPYKVLKLLREFYLTHMGSVLE